MQLNQMLVALEALDRDFVAEPGNDDLAIFRVLGGLNGEQVAGWRWNKLFST